MTLLGNILGQLVLGWLIADFLGGALHWLEDRVLSERMPIVGAAIVVPNRRHHREPMAFASGSFIDRNLNTMLAALILSAAWVCLGGVSLTWATASIGGLLSAQVHYLAHQPRSRNRALRVAQEIGLLQSSAHHAGHHRPPSDRRYCVLTDWLNPIVDSVGLWAWLERGLRVVGIRAGADA